MDTTVAGGTTTGGVLEVLQVSPWVLGSYIPGLGPIVAMGPIAGMLTGAATGESRWSY